jgi:chemotaxis methyl-accepting protein methylase
LNICLDFNPRNVVVLEQVIWACMNLEKDDMALKYLNIIPVFERNQMWYFNSIVANLNTGYKKRATKLLNKALKIWPDNNDLKQLYYEC